MGGGGAGAPSLSNLLPFPLPSSTRLLVHVYFALGLVHFRLGGTPTPGDASALLEAGSYLERARLLQARLVARRFWREKGEKGAAGAGGGVEEAPASSPAPSVASSSSASASASASAGAAAAADGLDVDDALAAESESRDTAWTFSASFLSSLATPAQASDLLVYARCVYMLACTHDRIAAVQNGAVLAQQQLQAQAQAQAGGTHARRNSNSSDSDTEPAPLAAPLSAAALAALSASSAHHSYRALVLRAQVTSLWHRVTAGGKVMSMHEDMWRVCVGMSVLDSV